MLADLTAAPDFNGTDSRIEMIANILASSQQQLTQLQNAMLANDHSEDDEIPDWNGKTPKTYGQRIGELERGIGRVLEANEDIKDDLADEARHRAKQAKRQRALQRLKLDEQLEEQEHAAVKAPPAAE